MTVLDNIILNLRDNRFVLDRKQARQRVCALAEKYGLTVDPDAQVGKPVRGRAAAGGDPEGPVPGCGAAHPG